MGQQHEELSKMIAAIRDKRELQQLIDEIKKSAPELVQGVYMQLSVAMANILAAEQIAEKTGISPCYCPLATKLLRHAIKRTCCRYYMDNLESYSPLPTP
ncbi:hypothetical protein ACQ86N_27950 [Puia sp. P3]|uniref:hypothetical protein n=1 Tax=Puia sp. P3 TaxID=3423952 RepID=UPI003D67A624